MAEETVHDVKNVPQGATVRVGSRGGLYYTTQNKPKSNPRPKPDKVLKGVGYEIHFYREATRYLVRYKGPNAEKVLKELRGED